jgi:hypothetical protein
MNRSNHVRAWALAAALAVAPIACGGGDGPASTTTSPTTAAQATSTVPTTAAATTSTTEAVRLIEVTYAGGQVAGGVQRTPVRLGEKVRLRVSSDVADEVHVHTYDVKVAVAAGQTAELDLIASIPGRHEVELEKKHKQLLVLEVK